MKTLIEVERNTWGKVKDYATIKHLSLSSAVDQLLKNSLVDSHYHLKQEEEKNEN
jgi:hypothetical protein